MIAAALQVIPNIWPSFLRPYPWLVGLFLLCGTIMFVYAALDHKQANGSKNYGNQAGRDNSGHNIVAGRDVYMGTLAPQPLPAVNDLKSAESLRPTLRARAPKKLYLESSSLVFKQSSSSEGLLGLVAPIENVEADLGHRATDALKIVAVLRFSRDNEEFGTIQRAYWMNRVENQVTIPIGESRFVVIGSYEPGVWLCYLNTRSVGLPRRLTAGQLRNLAEQSAVQSQPMPILLNPDVHVELKILSMETGESLLKKSYKLSIYRNSPDDFVWEELK